MPAERPRVTRAHLEGLEVLGTPDLDLTAKAAADFIARFSEALSLYVGNDSEWREHFKLARGHELMLRACKACGLLRYPPSHACPWCAALEWEWKEVSGKGHIYS